MTDKVIIYSDGSNPNGKGGEAPRIIRRVNLRVSKRFKEQLKGCK